MVATGMLDVVATAVVQGSQPTSTGIPNAVITGIVTGSIIAMGAIGLGLVYSIAEVPNFAHGELLMIGAYMALFVNKPGTVPVFELVATGTRSIGPAGSVVLWVIAAGGVLGMVLAFDGRDGLEGSWLPGSVSTPVGAAVTLGTATAVGLVVVLTVPSILGGIILAGVLVGVIAPVVERLVYGHFRARSADLATMLIVSLGVSFILRFGTQAIYGGGFRSIDKPDVLSLGDTTLYVNAAKFLDFYLTGRGLVVDIRETGGVQEGVRSTSIETVQYAWGLVALAVLLTIGAAVGGYLLRKRRATGAVEGQTFGPKIVGFVAGLVALPVLALVLAGSGSVPGGTVSGTRVRLLPLRLVIVLVAIGMMLVLHLLLQETKLGTAMRASSDNLDLAKVTGINTDRVMMSTWILAGVFAGIAGALLGMTVRVQVNIGFNILLPLFAATILGGIRSAYGIIIGSYVVGIAMEVGFTTLPLTSNAYRFVLAFVVLFVVLLVKPEGIAGGS